MTDEIKIVVALLWPLLKWVLAIDVTWQLARIVYFWQTPGISAGWTFLGHFAVLVALTCFVAVSRPQGAFR